MLLVNDFRVDGFGLFRLPFGVIDDHFGRFVGIIVNDGDVFAFLGFAKELKDAVDEVSNAHGKEQDAGDDEDVFHDLVGIPNERKIEDAEGQ